MVRMTHLVLAVTVLFVGTACRPAGVAPASAPEGLRTAAGADLEQAGHWSENLYDRAAANDWSGAASDLESLRGSLTRLRSAFGENRHLATALDQTEEIGTAVTARNARDLARLANAVTRDVALLSAQTNPPVPVEVTLLDYYGREIEIWSTAGDIGRLRDTQAGTRATWRRLEPKLAAQGTAVERQRFGALVTRLDAARTIDDFRILATPILDEVDNLEKAFAPK